MCAKVSPAWEKKKYLNIKTRSHPSKGENRTRNRCEIARVGSKENLIVQQLSFLRWSQNIVI